MIGLIVDAKACLGVTAATDSAASVDVSSYDANSMTLETSTGKPGFLVLSEIYYPAGWNATIDGKPTDIYKTNFVLRGFSVPAGDHTLTLKFEPESSIWGARMAWAGHIIIWISGLLAAGMLYRNQSLDF